MPLSPTERNASLFVAQFQRDGDDYLYRKTLKGPAIRVSADERDTFIRLFSRRIMYLNLALIAAVLLFSAAVIARALTVKSFTIEAPIIVGVGLLLAVFMPASLHVWHAPARALAERPVVAPQLTRDEVESVAMERMTWGRLGAAVAGLLVGLFILGQRIDLWTGANRLWLVLSAVAMVGLAYRAVLKLRFEHAGRRA